MEDAEEEKKSYTVTQYNTSVQRYLKNKVPRVWVKGVITQLQVRGRVAYITIAEFEEGNPRPMATLQTFMWSSELESYNHKFESLPTPFKLKAELKVSFFLEAEFYVPFGKFQPKVLDIDENFTLGEIAQTRKKIIDALKKEGLLDKNKQVPLSPVPLSVGLITAPGSAAYNDFNTVLLESGYSFQIYFYGAKMQGEATESTVIKALKFLGGLPLDVICLVRGGGAKTDLIYFDSEKICRAIAGCKVPVLTGIGHEIDSSIADMVSHNNCITPTDCAKYLENRTGQAYGELDDARQNLASNWGEALVDEKGEFGLLAQALKHRWDIRGKVELERIGSIHRGISVEFNNAVENQKEFLKNAARGLQLGPGKLLKPEKDSIRYLIRGIRANWKAATQKTHEALKFNSKLIHNLNPQRTLERGYSLVRNNEGKVITGVQEVSEGEEIITSVKDGSINSKVIQTVPSAKRQ